MATPGGRQCGKWALSFPACFFSPWPAMCSTLLEGPKSLLQQSLSNLVNLSYFFPGGLVHPANRPRRDLYDRWPEFFRSWADGASDWN